MKQSPWLWPALGVGTAVITVVASYLVPRFAPSPVAVTSWVLLGLLATLATLGYLATKRGHAATYVAIALLMPYLMISAVSYAGVERASSGIESFFEDESGSEEDFFDDEEFFDGEESFEDEGGTYGSDPALDGLWDECETGDAEACDELYLESPLGSEYESFAEQNGGGF